MKAHVHTKYISIKSNACKHQKYKPAFLEVFLPLFPFFLVYFLHQKGVRPEHTHSLENVYVSFDQLVGQYEEELHSISDQEEKPREFKIIRV